MNRRLGSEKTNLVVVNDKAVIIKEDPLFVFDTPPGYEIATTVDSAVLWKEGRPKPVGDTDAQSDLSVWVRKADIDGSQFVSANPKLVKSLSVGGYRAKYYKIIDESAGNPYLTVIDIKDGRWIYIESAEQKLLDQVLATFTIKNSK